jgi:hypothetical protein
MPINTSANAAPTFGGSPATGNGGDVKRQFKVTELTPSGDGGAKFVWDRDTQSSPINAWEFAVSLRTVKEHYPGVSGNPTEQVLGWNYDDFDLEGKWDDRYAGAGFADQTRIAMEALAKRGNKVRLEFEGLNVVGIITKVTITYRTKWLNRWVLHFSPHYREGDEQVALAPPAVANPNTYQVQASAIYQAMTDTHAQAPKQYLAGTTYSDVSDQVQAIGDTVDLIASIVSNRVLLVQVPTAGSQPVSSLARLSQAFGSLQVQAATLLPLVVLPSDTSLMVLQAAPTLALEAWARGLAYQARVMVNLAWRAAQDLSARVDPDALALYRPKAGESLYSISIRFYQTPNRWRDIYERNRLRTFTLSGLETLVIPSTKVAR